MNGIINKFCCALFIVTTISSYSCKPKDLKLTLEPTSKTAVLEEDGYFVWGASPIKGDDGLYHVLYSRWKKEYSFNAWVTHSEVAHAVSENLFGPYKFKNVALPARGDEYWDGHCTHNPTVHKFGDKYYLYYMGNRGDGKNIKNGLNWTHRNNQRIGVAVASDLNGEWKRFDKPLVDVSPDSTAADALATNNPAVTQMPDGRFLMVYKCIAKKRPLPFGGPVGHLAAISDSPTGPFVKSPNLIFSFDKSDFPAEDPFIWSQNGKFYAIVKDMKGAFTNTGEFALALFESEDGKDWSPSKNVLVSKRVIRWNDGTEQKVDRLERPQLYIENGCPKAIFLSVNPNNFTHTYNVHIPVKFD